MSKPTDVPESTDCKHDLTISVIVEGQSDMRECVDCRTTFSGRELATERMRQNLESVAEDVAGWSETKKANAEAIMYPENRLNPPLASPVAPPESELAKRLELLEWAIKQKDRQILEFSDEINKRGARISELLASPVAGGSVENDPEKCEGGEPCWRNPETGYLEACPKHDAIGMDRMMEVDAARKSVGGSARIAEIASRLAAATPGPWNRCRANDWDNQALAIGIGNNSGTVADVWKDGCMSEPGPANADFIAAAPDDIAFLLKLVPEGWVKVTPETMPTDRAVVLCYAAGYQEVCVYRADSMWPFQTHSGVDVAATHWRNRPAPPAAEEEGSSL